ncbi:IPT/TIG domain-containing protein [Spirochaeta africana]|uniref:Transglutaminase-like enzyme, predicted cysteine protease n=1 Tax=Spirochaeta africana (strain ATCC 700263 / DSM 8902 / Z-7692) TaxID=889378 RepID=H9ULX4_SPIAZ|nr:IPT/TIG domain-containing protein [Spirochaeta africana]AFG38517.1 transglutaminase-like enzyme, predicted cysteine protease [Spirochaeta africana DSM 8902]
MNHRVLLLAAVLLLVVLMIWGISTLAAVGPRIDSVSPTAGRAGDVVIVEGRGFSESGRIEIGGRVVPRANIREWADRRIRFSVPGPVYTGLVRVAVNGTVSNAMLFTNRESAPTVSGGEAAYQTAPFIYSVSPNVSAPGREVTISGRNFGVSSAAGSIVLRPQGRADDEIGGFPSEYVVPSSSISLWSTDTIRFFAPYGIVADQVMVRTAHGESDLDSLELQDLVGTYRYRNPQEIVFSYALTVAGAEAVTAEATDVTDAQNEADPAAGNVSAEAVTTGAAAADEDQERQADEESRDAGVSGELVLWLPAVPESPFQRAVEYTRLYPEPRYADQDMLKYVLPRSWIEPRTRLTQPGELVRKHVALTRYTVETTLLPSAVRSGYQADNPLYREYLGPTAGVPVDSATRSDARSLGGSSSNPLTIARNLFSGVRARLQPAGEDAASSREYAVLMASLLRSRDIPARVITGVLIPPGDVARYHHWVEWFALDFGWVPMDPFLADAIAAELPWAAGFEEEPGYYSENLDAHRAALHRGDAIPRRIDRFSTLHTVADNPMPADQIVYGNLNGLDLRLVWQRPLVMFSRSH